MMNKIFLGTFLAVSVTAAMPLTAGDIEAGKAKSVTCAGCHGVDGNSANPEWPSIAGQSTAYLIKQLKDFKAGNRENAMMVPMAAALNDQDMEDVAAFYASQKPKGGAANPDMLELGQRIYRGGIKERKIAACMACHSPDGSGNPAAKFPTVAGQHAAYSSNQLKAFRSGARANDPEQMMRNTAHLMTDEEITAVASYIQGLY